MKTAFEETISLPRKSVGQFFRAIGIFESAQDEMEDFLIVNNKFLINKIKIARKEHLENKTENFQNLIKKYV